MARPPPTPAQKRTKIIPVSNNDFIQQLRLLSDDSQKVVDYFKGPLNASKDNSNKIHYQSNNFY